MFYKFIALLIVLALIILPTIGIIWLTLNKDYGFAFLELVHIYLLNKFFQWIKNFNLELEDEPAKSGGNDKLGMGEKVIAIKESGSKKKVIKSK